MCGKIFPTAFWDRCNTKMSDKYGNSHYKYKTVSQTSYLYDGDSHMEGNIFIEMGNWETSQYKDASPV